MNLLVLPCFLPTLRRRLFSVAHRLNTELDLNSLIGLHVHSFTHWLRHRKPPNTRIWAHIRGRYWSAKIGDMSLWPAIVLPLKLIFVLFLSTLQSHEALKVKVSQKGIKSQLFTVLKTSSFKTHYDLPLQLMLTLCGVLYWSRLHECTV
jgi:hypothetical protein